MRNCCRRNMILICIVLLLVVNVLGISCAKTLVDRIKRIFLFLRKEKLSMKQQSCLMAGQLRAWCMMCSLARWSH